MKINRLGIRPLLRVLGLSLLFYVGIYLCLSINGGYEPGKTGKIIQFGLPTWDVYVWQPEFGRYDPYYSKTDAWGFALSPLIKIDRSVWHKDIPGYKKTDSGEVVQLPPPATALWHPRMKHNVAVIQSYADKIETTRKNHDVGVTQKLYQEMYSQMQ